MNARSMLLVLALLASTALAGCGAWQKPQDNQSRVWEGSYAYASEIFSRLSNDVNHRYTKGHSEGFMRLRFVPDPEHPSIFILDPAISGRYSFTYTHDSDFIGNSGTIQCQGDLVADQNSQLIFTGNRYAFTLGLRQATATCQGDALTPFEFPRLAAFDGEVTSGQNVLEGDVSRTISFIDDAMRAEAPDLRENEQVHILSATYNLSGERPTLRFLKTGYVGDVLSIHLEDSALSDYRFNDEQRGAHQEIPPGHEFPANDAGYVAQIDGWDEVLRMSGLFFYVPVITGTSELALTVTDSQSNDLPVRVTVTVLDGYSTTGPDAVTFDSEYMSKLDIYRQQQRLKHLGFPDQQGNPLVVDGVKGQAMEWAIGLFTHAVHGTSPRGVFSRTNFDREGQDFLNAANAPHWIEFGTGSGYLMTPGANNAAQPERWGTSWAHEVLVKAVETWAGNPASASEPFRMSGASVQPGGPSAYHTVSHLSGTNIDIEVPPTNDASGPFYRTRTISGTLYIAARTDADQFGDNHIVTCSPTGACSATAWAPGQPLPQGALPHTLATYNSLARLQSIATLIVDNLDLRPRRYDLNTMRGMLNVLIGARTASGASVDLIYFNDPRTWDLSGVGFAKDHGGHFHLHIAPPSPRRL